MKTFEYGFYADCLSECAKKFGSIEDLPIIDNPYKEIAKTYTAGKVLDIGAGKDKVVQRCLNLSDDLYFSLDSDPRGEFNYTSIDEVPESELFSLVTANQVFEHILLQDSINLACNISKHLEKNGYFISTVPNIQHPVRHRSNITHVTYWEFKALYTLYRYAGLQVMGIARYSKRHPRGLIEKTLARYINRIYRIDWCDSILIVGKKQV